MIRDPSDGSVKKSALRFSASHNSGERLPSIDAAEGGADTYTALKARHGETWGIKQPEPMPKTPFKSMSAQQLAEHYAKHDLGFKPKPEEI